ncbi:trypsin, alkaline C-like [Anticarsia gemmatalis]|uniref:trypsin, alkaline C-like n=1 Tax=Anticarsia gemmatalis TaxID=129554 RepID=UPI003F763A95
MRSFAFLAILVASVTAGVPRTPGSKIIGGSVTTIDKYPDVTPLLYSMNFVNFRHYCGGSILNQRAILTAAHCVHEFRNVPAAWRIRVGSALAHSGGFLHYCGKIIIHPNYDRFTTETDIALMHTVGPIVYIENAVQPARIAGTNYHLADNEEVWAVGWGVYNLTNMAASEELRHVQMWTVNQEICRERYVGRNITDNMLCSGWLDVGGRDTCRGDSGGPLYHHGVIVGICSFGRGCGEPEFPGVNVRVSRFTTWIQENA